MIEKLKEWTGSGVVGGVAFAAFTAVASWLTGSWVVVWFFVKFHFWESLSCALVVLGAGIIIGLSIRGHIDRKQIAAKDAVIAKLKNVSREHSNLFDEFCSLSHDEQRLVVSIMLSEPGGLAPTDEHRSSMGNWVAMNRFIRFDSAADRLHLADGVREVILENPEHAYSLMAARVADLERAVLDNARDAALSDNSVGKLVKLIPMLSDDEIELIRKSLKEGQITDKTYINQLTHLTSLGIFDESVPKTTLQRTWALSADALIAIKENKTLLGPTGKPDAQQKYKTPSDELIMQMSPVVASRVYRAYKRGEYIPLSEIEPAAINSIGSKDGLFEYKQMVNPFGQPLEAKNYGLTRAWRAFLDDPVHLRQLETIAAGFLSPEE